MATIRRATEHDTPFLWEMLLVAADWNPATERRTITDVMGDPTLARYVEGWPRPGDVGVVADHQQRVGAAWWRLFPCDDPGYGFVRPDTPEISIGVSEGFRCRGIGTQLLTNLVDCALLHGVPALSLSVEVGNPALRLYTRLGWRVIGRSGGSLTMLLPVVEPTHPQAAF